MSVMWVDLRRWIRWDQWSNQRCHCSVHNSTGRSEIILLFGNIRQLDSICLHRFGHLHGTVAIFGLLLGRYDRGDPLEDNRFLCHWRTKKLCIYSSKPGWEDKYLLQMTGISINSFQQCINGSQHKTFYSQNTEMKANYAERAFKTIKTRICRYKTFKQSDRYIDRFQGTIRRITVLLTPNLNWLNQTTKKRCTFLPSCHERRPHASKQSDHKSSMWVIKYEFRT